MGLLFLIGMAIFLGITEGYYIAIIICAQLMFFFLIILILPKRLEVWYDSVKIVTICGYKHSLPMHTITTAEYASLCEIGIKCATSLVNRVRIVRNSGFNYIVTPEDPEQFILAVRQVLSPSLVVV